MTQKQQRLSNQQISTDLNSFKRDAIAKIILLPINSLKIIESNLLI